MPDAAKQKLLLSVCFFFFNKTQWSWLAREKNHFMVDSEKNSCVQDAWSWWEMWFRSEPEGLVGWGSVEGWTGFGIGEWVGMEGGVGALHRTSDGSVCGQGGCQTLGLWIAGVGRKMSKNRKDGTG